MSNTNIIRFVSICTLCCGLLMFLLFITMGRSNATKNGFSRRFPVTKLSVAEEVDLKGNNFYIAGYTSANIYLGNRKKPLELWVGDKNLKLQFPEKIKAVWQSTRLSVDSPYVYLADGISPKFFRGDLQNLKMDTFLRKSSYFTTAANISPGSFAVRAVNIVTKENMLLKIRTDSPHVITSANTLKKQIDGIFCTDGQLKYDKTSHKLVYMYYYRNQCLVLDTNLNLIRTVRTIDTTTVAKISIAHTSDQGNATFSAPPSFVNATVCLHADRMYIRSALLGDNESPAAIDKNNLVDVYSMTDGHYIQTFYIPMQHEESFTEMCIIKDKLIALYSHFYVAYNLSSGSRKAE
ncbi:hypothetical protein GO495_15635 [Chitinophaga oryziterrae]|uniref:Uncharacterized protein n=1 Tax=Chitinophaga oryziterrae TaxID=1031224 RepID=A0A6N8JA57_9BACT|nr:hypothetical protein [Chitinophaga oryziterrae]MVT42023.1 hypothetical protein [Chitinophaga oryziterrae]